MSETRSPDARQPPASARRLGAGLLWFAVLGGVAAWAVHLFLAWGAVELACSQEDMSVDGTVSILGLSVRGFAAVATAVPLVVALLALYSAWWFRSHRLSDPDEPRQNRARFMSVLGTWLDGFAVLMIIFGGIAVIWFTPCGP